MKNIRMRIKTVTFVSILIAALGFCLALPDAWAEIEELRIGIGIDADTLNPQEQTTSLPINMCE
ncbi:MAG: hypothetical protein GTO24_21560, partial [candidate division Zixibacteria bacterium]|nr:hypothetical protein [candidate division Zixibacteria bacterium]